MPLTRYAWVLYEPCAVLNFKQRTRAHELVFLVGTGLAPPLLGHSCFCNVRGGRLFSHSTHCHSVRISQTQSTPCSDCLIVILRRMPMRIADRETSPYSAAARPPIFVPITSPEMMISTRRFCWRPCAVSLPATGLAGPKPCALTETASRPCCTR